LLLLLQWQWQEAKEMSFGVGIDLIWQQQQQRPPNFEQKQDLFRAFFFTTQRFLNYLIRSGQSEGKRC